MNKTNKNTKGSPIEESIQLLVQATNAIGPVQRLTTLERSRGTKARRGGHEVAPVIAAIALKYGIDLPGVDGTVINTALARVQSLVPLVNAAADAHATITDAHTSASRSMWSASTALYSMLKRASKVNASIATELQPVEEWFRPRKPQATKATATTTPATTAATPETPVVAPAAAVTSTVAKAAAPVTTTG
jgi:predicted component of type VI protein secretion system